ncbi:MAG: PAS domain S-box protein [Chitinophagaceae bacterium]|nr:PAS domain S-box protein [Chitinophagaceae bacterium]
MNKYKRRISLFLYVCLAIVISSFAVLFFNFRKQVKLQNEVVSIENNLLQADSLTNNLLQIESDKRGFQLTSDISYLKNFYTAKTACNKNLAALEKNLVSTADKTAIRQIDSLMKIRIANLDSGLVIFRSKGTAAAVEFMQLVIKKDVREKLSKQLQFLRNGFLQKLTSHTADINKRSTGNLTGLIVLLSIFIVMMLIAAKTFKRAQKKMIRNHIKFKEAQRIAKIGSWEWDIISGKVSWSQEQFRLLGEDRKDFTPSVEGYLDHLSPEDQKITRSILNDALEGKSNYAIEQEIIRKDGSRLMVYNQGTVLYDENKKPVGMIGTTQDISERKKAERELTLAQKKYRTIVDNSADGIYQSTIEGIFIMANPAMARILGYRSAGELISSVNNIGAQLYVNVGDRQRMAELLAQYDNVENFEVPLRTRTGETIWVSESARAVRNEKGGIIYFEGNLKDITERKKVEEKLIIAQRKYQAIFENTAEGIYQSTPDGRFIMANPSMARIFGYDSPGELISSITNIGTQIYTDPVERSKMSEIIRKQGRIENYEVQVLTKSNETIWINVNIHSVKDDEGNISFFEGTLKDVTKRKKSEEEILQLNRSLDQFANITAHDLQEPIRMVSGFLGLLDKKYSDAIDDQGKNFIFRAKDGADRMSLLIKDLLEFSRSGNKAAKKEYVDLSFVMDLVDKDLSIVMADTGTKLRLPSAMPVVYGTQSALYRLLLNLVSNGIKFRKKDTPPEITIALTELADCWEFTVEDNGIGVAEKDQPRLFQAFQRLHRRDEYPGTGLGLVTCKKIVETHGGRIWMKSEFGKGTTFHFTISKAEGAIMAA